MTPMLQVRIRRSSLPKDAELVNRRGKWTQAACSGALLLETGSLEEESAIRKVHEYICVYKHMFQAKEQHLQNPGSSKEVDMFHELKESRCGGNMVFKYEWQRWSQRAGKAGSCQVLQARVRRMPQLAEVGRRGRGGCQDVTTLKRDHSAMWRTDFEGTIPRPSCFIISLCGTIEKKIQTT